MVNNTGNEEKITVESQFEYKVNGNKVACVKEKIISKVSEENNGKNARLRKNGENCKGKEEPQNIRVLLKGKTVGA